jgi:Protein of unknown function (DUF3592)
VIAISRGRSSRGSRSDHPIFEFRDRQGHVHRVRSRWSAIAVHRGDKVNVWYDPLSPDDAVLEEDTHARAPFFCVVFGLLWTVACVRMTWKQYRRHVRAKAAADRG